MALPEIPSSAIHNGFTIVYKRISLSKLTICYFLFSLLFAIVSVLLQAQAYQTNLAAANLFSSIINKSNSSTKGFALLERKGDELLWCTGYGNSKCQTLWSADFQNARNGIKSAAAPEPTQSALNPALTSNAAVATPVSGGLGPLVSQLATAIAAPPAASPAPTTPPSTPPIIAAFVNGGSSGSGLEVDDDEDDVTARASLAQLTTPSDTIFDKRDTGAFILVTKEEGNTSVTITLNRETLILDQRCLLALNWPLETLDNTKREDIVFINFHLWVFGLSVVALLNESVVHMLANLLTHILVAAWGAFQLVHTRAFQMNYGKIVTNGLCDGQNLLPNYWRERANAEIPGAALNGVALLVCAVLTWRLIRTYNWATFKRIGADRNVSKVYKIVLSLSTVLQLSLFFVLVSIALWIDQLCNGVFGAFATQMTLYRAIYISVAVLLVPWIILGWKGSRNANRTFMAIFIAFNVFLVGGWGVMFSSVTFRYTFFQWQFFMLMEIGAVVLLVASLWLSIWSRMNFDVDLSKWLNPNRNSEDDDDVGIRFTSGKGEVGLDRSKSNASSFHTRDDEEKRVGGPSDYDEKIDYPSNGVTGGGVPTYAAFTRNNNPNILAPSGAPPVPSGQLGYLGNSGPSISPLNNNGAGTSLGRGTSLTRSDTTLSNSTMSSQGGRRKYLIE